MVFEWIMSALIPGSLLFTYLLSDWAVIPYKMYNKLKWTSESKGELLTPMIIYAHKFDNREKDYLITIRQFNGFAIDTLHINIWKLSKNHKWIKYVDCIEYDYCSRQGRTDILYEFNNMSDEEKKQWIIFEIDNYFAEKEKERVEEEIKKSNKKKFENEIWKLP